MNGLPSYLVAAEGHTIANNGGEGESLFSAAGDIVTKFVPSAIAASVNEIYNIAPTVGNFLGGNFEKSDLRKRLVELDNDYAQYYDNHKLGIDTAGFILGSLAPGMGGVKALNVTQNFARKALTGESMGAWTSRSLNLLAPRRDYHLDAAAEAIARTGNPFTLKEANLLKALGAGVQQNFLEAAAFETVVAATMNQSPILEDMDRSDLFWNIMKGAAVGGAIGGVLSGAGSAWKVSKAGAAAELELAPYTIVEAAGKNASSDRKLVSYFHQLDYTPAPLTEGPLAARSMEMHSTKIRHLENSIIEEFQKLSGGDADVAMSMFQLSKTRSATDNIALFEKSLGLSRGAGKLTPEEALLKATNKKIADAGPNPVNLTEQELEILSRPVKAGYVRLVGAGAAEGKVFDTPPAILSIFDEVSGKISVSKNSITIGKKTFQQDDVVDVLSLSHKEVEARQVWAERLKKWDDDKNLPPAIGIHDIPLIDKAIRDGVDQIIVKDINGAEIPLVGTEAIREFKERLIAPLSAKLLGKVNKNETVLLDKLNAIGMNSNIPEEALRKTFGPRLAKHSNEEIAKILNIHPDALEGVFHENWSDARKFWREEYAQRLTEKGVRPQDLAADPLTLPSHVKIVSREIEGAENLEGLALAKQRTKLYDQSADRITSAVLGETLPNLPDEVLITGQAGPSGMGFSSGALGSVQSFFEFVGQRVHNLKVKTISEAHSLMSPEVSFLMRDLDGAVEFSVLNEKLRNLPHRYALKDGKMVFKGKAEEALAANWPLEIPIQSPQVASLMSKHMERNAKYMSAKGMIRANEGLQHRFDPDVYYPIPRNPNDTPYFALVVDPSVTGTGHSKMIYAETPEQLNSLMSQVKQNFPEFDVYNKVETEAYFKARGTYEFERSLNENYINTALARKGISSSFLPQTDPKIILGNFVEWHTTRSANMVREAVSHKYARQFDAMMQAAESATGAAKSKMSYVSAGAYAENAVNNNASNIIKLALDITKMEEYPIWSSANKMLDMAGSRLARSIEEIWNGATSAEHLQKVSAALERAGAPQTLPSQITPALYEAMNGKIPRGILTNAIGQANGLLATFALRLDPFNALNNLLGAQVLLGTETRALIRAIKEGSEESAGELAALMKIGVPGTKELIESPTKLIANSIQRYFKNPELRDFYRANGFITDISTQQYQILDDMGAALARDGNMSAAFAKMKEWANKGEALTGNRVAEEMNRFIAADVMKQITDVAVKGGIIDEGAALTYINTFVNRTQGNFIASQRPLMFQGPIGQAIGLFQTYQFNLIQQMFRHIGEGQAKSAATALGLQFSIYGMNGLPAFNAINTHIIGNAEGNKNHADLTSAAYSVAGKTAGDWITYGAGSNFLSLFHPDLKNNLYTRGDVNPRTVTVVPNSIQDIPIVNASAKLFGNIVGGLKQLGDGAPFVETFLRGLEHNGVSRPLAGMAQALEGLAKGDQTLTVTNSHLNQVMSHDLYSLATLTRIAGAKPLDEAITTDMAHRFRAYDRSDKLARSTLGESIKLKFLSGQDVDAGEIENFAADYVKNGGRQENFNKFMTQNIRNATQSQLNQLKGALGNPRVQQYQRLMGGYALEDLENGSLKD